MDQPGNVTMKNNGDSYAVTSTVPIRGLSAEVVNNGTVMHSASTETEKTSYKITFADGKYIVQ